MFEEPYRWRIHGLCDVERIALQDVLWLQFVQTAGNRSIPLGPIHPSFPARKRATAVVWPLVWAVRDLSPEGVEHTSLHVAGLIFEAKTLTRFWKKLEIYMGIQAIVSLQDLRWKINPYFPWGSCTDFWSTWATVSIIYRVQWTLTLMQYSNYIFLTLP